MWELSKHISQQTHRNELQNIASFWCLGELALPSDVSVFENSNYFFKLFQTIFKFITGILINEIKSVTKITN